MKFPLLKSFVLLLLTLGSVSLWAQKKQKDVQEHSMFVSGPVKIDGKLNDWQDTLQAFNRSALIAYTIANDTKNLYLIVKSSDAINNAKILAGGISLAINTEGKKKDKDAFSITFPVINPVTRTAPQRITSAIPGTQRQMQGGQRQTDRGAQRPARATDSVLIERRKAQIAQFREIKVFGFKQVKDSLLSIYNEYGIKAAAGYDVKGSLVYELAVPLNLLETTAEGRKELAYNVKINGRLFASRSYEPYRGGDSGTRDRRGSSSETAGPPLPVSESLDFWGKYTLTTQ